VLGDDKIRLAQIIVRMNEQQFYRKAGALSAAESR